MDSATEKDLNFLSWTKYRRQQDSAKSAPELLGLKTPQNNLCVFVGGGGATETSFSWQGKFYS